MSSTLNTTKQDEIIFENMRVVHFWLMALGGDLQDADRDDLEGHLYLTLVEAIRKDLLDDVEKVTNWLSVRIRFSAYRWLIKLRKLPSTNMDFDVPDEFQVDPSLDVEDLVAYACQDEKEEEVASLLLDGFSRGEVAMITGVLPQRVSELTKRIFDRARRKNNRLEKAETIRRTASHFSREVHGES